MKKKNKKYVRITLELPNDLVEFIDIERKKLKLSRSKYIEMILTNYMNGLEKE